MGDEAKALGAMTGNNKAIAVVSQDPKLKEWVSEMDKKRAEANERIKFVEKQLEKIKTDFHASIKPTWEEITVYLQEKGLLSKDYDKTKHALFIDHSEGVIYFQNVQAMREAGLVK